VTPPDWKIVSVKKLTAEQRNDLCSSCHAKASPLWTSFRPGDRFFDHFDLTTLENPDYHPDGRDLGENYTLTSWRQSPCAKSGRIDCVHCHTSSGRYKFKERPNDACLPCHEERVKNAAAHTRHPGDGPGTRCTDCHMPKTEFARMLRSDHSMRPPSPAATRELGSPNACSLCHSERSVAWAEKAVRDSGGGQWSERILREGRLVRRRAQRGLVAASAGPGLPGGGGPRRDRGDLARAAPRRQPGPVEVAGPAPARHRPLAARPRRGSDGARAGPGVSGRRPRRDPDEVRLVRVRAAAALSAIDPAAVPEPARGAFLAARAEHERSLLARPDDFASQYNLGNVHLERGEPAAAAERYRKALALRPDHVASLVNLSMAEARVGRLAEAEAALREAVRVQRGRPPPTSTWGSCCPRGDGPPRPRPPCDAPSTSTPATRGPPTTWPSSCRGEPEGSRVARGRAAESAPADPRHAFTQAFYLQKAGDAAAPSGSSAPC